MVDGTGLENQRGETSAGSNPVLSAKIGPEELVLLGLF